MKHLNRKANRPQLSVTISGKKYRLEIRRAFSLAHQLLCGGHIDSAMQISEWLQTQLPDDRRVKVLLARAKARKGNYNACSELLNEAFIDVEDRGDIRGTLHTAIVYRASNLLGDSRKEMGALCSQFPQFPSLWLFAGDLWFAVGRRDRAVAAWRAAVKRDAAGPQLVGTAARHRIAELAKSHRTVARRSGRSFRANRGRTVEMSD